MGFITRAELVDGLLSGVLSTDLFLSSLDPRVVAARRKRQKLGGETAGNVNVNRFSILDCSGEEDYDSDYSYIRGNVSYLWEHSVSASATAALEAMEYDDSGNGNGIGFGGGGLEASRGRASSECDGALGGTRATVALANADTSASPSDAGDDGGGSEDSVEAASAEARGEEGGRGMPVDKRRGSERVLGIGKGEGEYQEGRENVAAGAIAAAREAVLRRYGAALIKFRVSVFLYYSSSAAVATPGRGGGQGEGTSEGREEGGAEGWGGNVGDPSELTMRRQTVLRSENLEVVAARLRQPLEDYGCCRSGDHFSHYHYKGFMPPSAEKEATVTRGVGAAGAAGDTGPSEKNCVRIAVGRAALCNGGDGGGGPRAEAYSVQVVAMLLASSGERDDVSLACWHGCCRRGCRLGGDSTFASEAPLRAGERRGGLDGEMEPGQERVTAAGVVAATPSAFVAPFASDPWSETDLPRASARAACIFATREENNVGDDMREPVYVQHGVRSSSQGGGYGNGVSIGDDERRVCRDGGRKRKRGFGGGLNSSTKGSSCPGLRPAVPPHYAKWVSRLPRESRGLLGRLGHHEYIKALEEILNRFLRSTEGFAAESSAAEPLTAAPDIWRALLLRRPHPSLTGLVEPAELALVGAERVVLPIPNPFYRRIFHDLCRVHGFRSRGGVAVAVAREKDRNEDGDGDVEGIAVEHRTVEVTRGFRTGGVGRDRNVAEEVVGVVGPMVPVETLLGSCTREKENDE